MRPALSRSLEEHPRVRAHEAEDYALAPLIKVAKQADQPPVVWVEPVEVDLEL